MKTRMLLIAVLSFTWTSLSAQSGWNFPGNEKDSLITAEKYALFSDHIKYNEYKQAVPDLQWLINNVPDLNESIYINGIKVFENLAETTEDPVQKRRYEDSTLLMYDLRIKYYNDEANIMNRKAYTAYRFFKNDKTLYRDLFEMYGRTVALNGNEVWDQNLLSYMDVLRRYKLAGGEITDQEILEIYNQLAEIIEHKKTLGKNLDRLDRINDNVDRLLTDIISVECDFIQDKLGQKLLDNTDDLGLAKRIFALSLAGGCSDIPIFMEAMKVIQQKEPSFAIAKLLGDRSYLNKDYNSALKYYDQAIELTDDNIITGNLYLNQATVYNLKGNKPMARKKAYDALDADPTKKDAYNFIGNLYLGSFEECKKGQNEAEDRAIFILAYEMFRRAGNSEAMQKVREQFPTMETIHMNNMSEGDKVNIGCWINQSVTIERR